jgi:hypothetical protein
MEEILARYLSLLNGGNIGKISVIAKWREILAR